MTAPIGFRAVVRNERLTGGAVLDQLEPPEAAEPPHVADRRMPFGELRELGAEDLAARSCLLDDPFLLERLDRRDRRGARERMAAVREPAGEVPAAHPVGDRLADDHRPE